MSDSVDSHSIEAPIGANMSPQKLALFPAVLAALGAIVLIGSEIWLVAVAALWALHGWLSANLAVDVILGILILPAAIWATWKTVIIAVEAERDPENQV